MTPGKKNRGIAKRILWSAIASPFIMLAVYALRNTEIGSLFFPVFMPVFLMMAFAFPNGSTIAGLPRFVWAALGINFLITWITLLIVVLVVGGLLSLFRKKKAQG